MDRMTKALENRDKIRDIRRRMLSGAITYAQAKAEAQPILDDIDAANAKLAKLHNARPYKASFSAMMR